jgi:biopolymer transport protein ExbD
MRRKRKVATAIFTDVAFILLLFFLVFAITSQRIPIPVDLPIAQHAQEAQKADLQLFVDKDGTLYNQERKIDLDQIAYAERISVYADEATEFSLVLPILQRLAELGVPIVQCVVALP